MFFFCFFFYYFKNALVFPARSLLRFNVVLSNVNNRAQVNLIHFNLTECMVAGSNNQCTPSSCFHCTCI